MNIKQALGLFIVVVTAAAQAPSNNFSDAPLMESYLWYSSAPVAGATREAGEPSHGDASVWWKYRAPGTGTLRLNVQAPFGTSGYLAAVYTGSGYGSLSRVTLTSEGGGKYRLPVLAGTVYHIALLVGAQHVQAELVFGLSVHLTTFDWTDPLVTTVTEQSEVTLGISTTEATSEIARVDFCIGSNVVASARVAPFRTTTTFPVGYHELFARLVKRSGPQPLELRGVVLKVVPSNDSFGQRILIATNDVQLAVVTGTASHEEGEPNHGAPLGGGSVWFSFQPGENGRLVLSANDSQSTYAHIYEGDTVSSLRAAGTNYSSSMMPYSLNVGLASNRVYHIAFVGPFTGRLRFYTPPSNDSFAGRSSLGSADVRLEGNTILTTREEGELGPSTNTLWWTWTAPTNGYFTIRAVSTNSFPSGAVYTGYSLGELEAVRSFHNLLRPVDVPVEAGKTYCIQTGTQAETEYFGFEIVFTDEILRQEFYVIPGTIQRMGRRGGGAFTVFGKRYGSFRVDLSQDLQNWTVLGTYTMGDYEVMPITFTGMDLPGQYFRLVPL